MSGNFPRVKGTCPACDGSSLFLGEDGYVTCSRTDCPNPAAADNLLHLGGLPTPLHLPVTQIAVTREVLRAALAQVPPGR